MEFYLNADEKTCNYLQRLGFEVDSRRSIIDFMFDSHKNDDDLSLFDSKPWKKYEKDYETVFAEYQLAKNEYSKQLQTIVDKKLGKKGTKFNWSIDDFSTKQVHIEVL